MIKIGSTEVDTIKIGANGVDSIMLNGVQIYPTATDFAITQHPQSQAGEVGDPATDYPFSVEYTPPEATVQWEWCNDGEGGCTNFSPIDGATDDTYIPVPSNGSDIVIGQNYDHFRAVVSLDGEPDIESDPAVLSVDYGPVSELTGDAKIFLKNPVDIDGGHYYSGYKPASWNNKSMESMPADNLFPDGQMMPLVAHNITSGELARFEAHGFNAGYRQNAYDPYSSYPDPEEWYRFYDDFAETDMKYVGYLQTITYGEIDDGAAEQRALDEMQQYLNDDRLDIWAWMLPYDDNTYLYYSTKKSSVQSINSAIRGADSTRPLAPLSTSDGTLTGNWDDIVFQYCNTVQQAYNQGGHCIPDASTYSGLESQLTYKQSVMVGTYAEALVADMDTAPTGKPWLKPCMELQCFTSFEDGNPARFNSTHYKAEMTHHIMLNFLSGCNSFWWYQANESYQTGYCGNDSTAGRAWISQGFDDILDLFKTLTDHSVDRAFLWGKGAKPSKMKAGALGLDTYASGNLLPITAAITSGSTGTSYKSVFGAWSTSGNRPQGGGRTAFPSESQLTFRDIEYKYERFVVATNSNPPDYMLDFYGMSRVGNNGQITVEFSGFPTDGTKNQLKAVDLISGTEYPISVDGIVTVVMPAMNSVILKVTAADGWIAPQ